MLRWADFPWPVLVFWVIWMVAAANRKKKGTPGRGSGSPMPGSFPVREAPGPEAPARGGMMDELRRAMEELKRAESQQVARDQRQVSGDQRPASGGQRQASGDERAAAQQKVANTWLAEQKRKAAARNVPKRAPQPARPGQRLPAKRPMLSLDIDDDDQSSEDPAVISLEGRDYDEEANAIIAARHKAADRVARVETSSEDLSTLQRARRESRPDLVIGGTAEHADWHLKSREIGAAGEHGPARKSVLARFANGSARSALVLSEIMGRPVGDRDG